VPHGCSGIVLIEARFEDTKKQVNAMKIIQFAPGHSPELAGTDEITTGNDVIFWLEIDRSEPGWPEKAQNWLGIRFDERHIRDTLNETHPPYYDGTDDYDLLIVRAICSNSLPEFPRTCPIAFIITNNAIVSIRPPEDHLFERVHTRFLSSVRKPPASPAMLLYQLLNQVTDGLLEHREDTSELLSSWQEQLLKRNVQFVDWHTLIRLHGQLRRLEVVTDSQMDAVAEWRDQTTMELGSSLDVRFNDLHEHLKRVYNHAVVVQHDIDSLVQIYFSANTQHTNDVLQFLTIISAIFLPLNLIAGVFGMNFSHLPFLSAWYGPWFAAALMISIAVGMLFWFRQKRWI
jgi:magnesium transporter